MIDEIINKTPRLSDFMGFDPSSCTKKEGAADKGGGCAQVLASAGSAARETRQFATDGLMRSEESNRPHDGGRLD
jgi:hypothetical protein